LSSPAKIRATTTNPK